MEDKRRFTRIIFSTPARLLVGYHSFETRLIDLSLKGALVETPEKFDADLNQLCKLHFVLEGSDVNIEMAGELVHIEDHSVGIEFEKIDIESVSHLRRLIELNVGSEELLHRDLENLSHPDDDE